MAKFFSVQSTTDAARLAAGGEPWPTELDRANLGLGFYAWAFGEAAEQYREKLVQYGAQDLQIVVYEISDADLGQLRTLDLTLWSDENVDTWMERYSQYGAALPHDWEHVVRGTDVGPEHYFAASVFRRFTEVR